MTTFSLATLLVTTFANLVSTSINLFVPEHTQPSQCNSFEEVEYCYYPGDPKSEKIIYFLHGFTNNVRAWGWNPVTKNIIKDWSKTNAVKLEKFFSVHEPVLLKNKKYERILYGDSMGGHNALLWAGSQTSLFARLAVICPALPKIYDN